MITILEPDKNIMHILGKPQNDSELRKTSCLMENEVPEGILLYQTLTYEMILLTKEEYREGFELKTGKIYRHLYEHYFLVPHSFDECKVISEIRGILSLLDKKEAGYRKYIVLTTTDCNARCFYCYEAGCEKMTMTKEYAAKIADFMIENRNPSEKMDILWFGGEPLYNADAIDVITDRLEKEKIEFSSSLITNAYLLDEAMLRRMKKWNVGSLQITLDGTEEIYNKRKAYIYSSDESPFRRVLNNIEGLLKEKYSVEIRLNMDGSNAKDLENLAFQLKERFSDYSTLKVYVRLIYQVKHKGKKEDYDRLYAMEETLGKLNLKRNGRVPHRMKITRCMADSGVCAVILPNGDLCSCEHFNESLPSWGNIDSKERNKEILLKWKEYREFLPQCKSCAYAPDCIRLKYCPEAFDSCPEEEAKYMSHRYRNGMLEEYRVYKEGLKK